MEQGWRRLAVTGDMIHSPGLNQKSNQISVGLIKEQCCLFAQVTKKVKVKVKVK